MSEEQKKRKGRLTDTSKRWARFPGRNFQELKEKDCKSDADLALLLLKFKVPLGELCLRGILDVDSLCKNVFAQPFCCEPCKNVFSRPFWGESCMFLACLDATMETPLFPWVFCCSSVSSPRYRLNPRIQVLVYLDYYVGQHSYTDYSVQPKIKQL